METKSIEEVEKNVTNKLGKELHEPYDYISDIGTLAGEFHAKLDGHTTHKIDKIVIAQIIILIKILDFLRGMQLCVYKGYPEQAGTLAASIFELVHTAISFSHISGAVEKWWQANSEQTMPRLIGSNIKNWKDLVESNYQHIKDGDSQQEYKCYQKLCLMKHSHPKMQGLIIEKDIIKTRAGPHSDEISINHAWYSLLNAGRLVLLLLGELLKTHNELFKDLNERFNKVYKKGGLLSKKFITKFNEYYNP